MEQQTAKEKRRIVRIVQTEFPKIYYESRKPAVFGPKGEWERTGRKYDIRGIESLLKEKTLEFIIDSEVRTDLDTYKEEIENKKMLYQK